MPQPGETASRPSPRDKFAFFVKQKQCLRTLVGIFQKDEPSLCCFQEKQTRDYIRISGMDVFQESLKYHAAEPAGKFSVEPTKPMNSQKDLSLAYSPGVAQPCLEINKGNGQRFWKKITKNA